jgi:hypothetical protein
VKDFRAFEDPLFEKMITCFCFRGLIGKKSIPRCAHSDDYFQGIKSGANLLSGRTPTILNNICITQRRHFMEEDGLIRM